jgi:protoheme IX farnesyltransferase
VSDVTIEYGQEGGAPAASLPAVSVATAGDFFALLKPRVMSLVVLTGLAGLVAAPGAMHPLAALTAVLCIAVGAGASGALNMWFDADIDAIMARTAKRPIPSGRVSPQEALTFGLTLSVFSVGVMGVLVNWLSAGLLAFTIVFYAVVYTMWLKRSTPHNIVIGGLAGAMPPAIGWAAATGSLALPPLVLVALIFLWTPPHFWALALYRSADYAAAGVPMLPVTAGEAETRRQILLYTIATIVCSALPVALGFAGVIYAAAALLGGAAFLWGAVTVVRTPGNHRNAMKLFGFSILYLFALFTALIVEAAIGLGPLLVAP